MGIVNAKVKLDIGYNEGDFEYSRDLSEVFCCGVETVVQILRSQGIEVELNLFNDSEESEE